MDNQEITSTPDNEREEKRAGIYTSKERNQFMKLRYHSAKSEYPFISINELADNKSKNYIGLSKSIIAKLEDVNIDKKNPPCRASTLRLYKEYFDCSYDYLMGDTECKKPEYYNIGKDPVLGLFDDSFYDNLKQLMDNTEFQNFNSYMLQAFMSNPKQLQYLLHTLFLHMYEIHNIEQNNKLKKAEKDVESSYYWFSLNTHIKNYLENTLMQSLKHGFMLHKQTLSCKEEENNRIKAEERKAFEESLPSLDLEKPIASTGEYEASLPPQTPTVEVLKITPISTEDSPN